MAAANTLLAGVLLMAAASNLLVTTNANNERHQQSHLSGYDAQTSASNLGEPVFRLEPPSVLRFSSSEGVIIPCIGKTSFLCFLLKFEQLNLKSLSLSII